MKVKEESEKVGLKFNIQETEIMASGPITSWQIDGETVETVADFSFLSSKITADGDCSHEIERHLLLGRKVITNLDSILKSRDVILPKLWGIDNYYFYINQLKKTEREWKLNSCCAIYKPWYQKRKSMRKEALTKKDLYSTGNSAQYYRMYGYSLSCVWLCDPTDCSPPSFSIHGILQGYAYPYPFPFSRGMHP